MFILLDLMSKDLYEAHQNFYFDEISDGNLDHNEIELQNQEIHQDDDEEEENNAEDEDVNVYVDDKGEKDPSNEEEFNEEDQEEN